MSEMPIRLHHGAISVPNLDESIAWYQEMLGFEVEQRIRIPGEPVEFAMLKRGDLRVELFAAENSKPMEANRREPNTAFLSRAACTSPLPCRTLVHWRNLCASAAPILCGYRISRGAPMRLFATMPAISLNSCSKKIWRKRRGSSKW